MFFLPQGVTHVFLYADPINMRWSEKKITSICVDEIGVDPAGGGVFLFYNRAKDQLRLFFLDDEGSQMLTKYLPENAFVLPVVPVGERSMQVPVSMLSALFKQ